MSKIVGHLKKHKEAYLTGGLLVLAGITYAIVKANVLDPRGGSMPDPRGGSSSHGNVDAKAFNFFGKMDYSPVLTMHKGTKGHPGFVTHCIETGDIFHSQEEAAKALSITPSVLSGHLNKKFDNADGYHFERLLVN